MRTVTMNLVLVFVIAALSTVPAHADETVVIAGAGPSTKVVEEFFSHFAEQDAAAGYVFEVPPRSIKHAGGIRSTSDNLFGRTGRPLTPTERGETKLEIPLARIPLAFVCDPDCGVRSVSVDDLNRILTGEVGNWKELGGADLPIRLVGREKGEAALRVLEAELPVMVDVEFDLVLHKDHQLVELLDTADRKGVLGFGAASNFDPSRILVVKELEVGVTVGLVYDVGNGDHPLVQAVRDYSVSEEWRVLVTKAGYLPPNPES